MKIMIDCTPDELVETIFQLVDCDVEVTDGDDEDDSDDDDDERDKLLVHLLSALLAAREKNAT